MNQGELGAFAPGRVRNEGGYDSEDDEEDDEDDEEEEG